LAAGVAELAGHVLVRLTDGLVHIAVGDGLSGPAPGPGGQGGAAGAVHQGTTVLGAPQEADTHGQALHLRTDCNAQREIVRRFSRRSNL